MREAELIVIGGVMGLEGREVTPSDESGGCRLDMAAG